jgi:hypothetical protein
MYLNIILTFLVLILILISGGVYFWWRNYGKKLFELMDNMKNITNNKMNPNMFKNMGDLLSNQDELFKSLNNMFSKRKK